MADLKNPNKADLDKDGKLSSYEKKRGVAIEKAMNKSEGMSRAQQAAIAIAKMKKEEFTEMVREILAEKDVDEAKAYDIETTDGGKTVKSFANDQEAKEFAQKNSNVKKATALEEDLDIGHIDNEPGMLKQFAFDTAEYAVKLYKLLHHYEQMEEQVDFPNWWQHKVMMAREYMSKATHYLEFETMKPQIDAAVDGHSEEELDEIKKAEFEKIKPGKELQLRGYGVVTVVANDGIVMKIKDSLDKVHTINLGQYNEKFLKEDEDAEPSKADLKKEKGFAAQSTTDQKKAARKKALQPILDKLEKAGTISRVDGKLKVNDMDAYKKAIATINEAVDQVLAESKATCCGRCGRTHVKGTECKKPYLTGKDHCRVR